MQNKMKVTIMYRNNFHGGDGWIYHPLTVDISNKCYCGWLRGTPSSYTFYEDGEWYTVDTWHNPCGHLDTYKNVYLESLRIKNNAVINNNQV